MPPRTVILSDTHLGATRHAAMSADALRPLWAGADRLLINGDAVELLHPLWRDRAAHEILRLTELCQADGVALTMLAGNHDPARQSVRHLELAAGRVLVTHGDVLHPSISPWALSAPGMEAAFHQALAGLPPDQRDKLEGLLEASRQAAHAHWTSQFIHTPIHRKIFFSPLRIFRLARYWHSVPRLAAELAARHRPDARFVVIGHTHRHGIWHVAGRTIINTGSFGFPGRPRAVIIEPNHLTVYSIRRHATHHLLAPHPLAQFDLNSAL